jgi:3-oxoadipate enol-lactonase
MDRIGTIEKGRSVPGAKGNGITINYKVDGEGEPLLMVSGLGADLKSWMIQLLSFKRHYRVIRFDNRGVGKSDKPFGPYSIRMMADDAIGLMDHLGIRKAHVLGMSMGGMIAQEIAINYPERVLRLILACTFACESRENGQTREYGKVTAHPTPESRDELSSLAFNKPFCRFVFGSLARLTTKKGWEIGFEAQRAAIRGHDALDRLAHIAAPTLVIAGTEDRVIRPSSSDTIAARIPRAELVWIEHGSHAIGVETRRQFNEAVLSFLHARV